MGELVQTENWTANPISQNDAKMLKKILQINTEKKKIYKF